MPLVGRPETMLSLARLDLRFELPWYVEHLRAKGIALTGPHYQEYVSGQGGEKPTSKELFALLGAQHYEDIDIDPSGGCTITHDLNNPVPTEFHERYDFVFEHGTLEHVFDIKTALSNVAHMTKVGGYVCHISPLNFINHGFYNFSLNIFNDFYGLNGFSDFHYWVLRYKRDYLSDQHVVVAETPYCSNWIYLDESLIADSRDQLCLAVIVRKNVAIEKIATPIQGIYDPKRHLPWQPIVASMDTTNLVNAKINLA